MFSSHTAPSVIHKLAACKTCVYPHRLIVGLYYRVKGVRCHLYLLTGRSFCKLGQ